MSDDDLCRSMYDAEWDRRDHLQEAASTPLAVLVVLGSALAFLFQRSNEPDLPWPVFEYTVLALAAIAYAYAVYAFVRSYFGYKYQRIPFPSQLVEARRGLREYYAKEGQPVSVADAEFSQSLEAAYMKAADRNAENNVRRGAYLHASNAAIVVTLVFTTSGAIPVAIQMRNDEPEPQKVEITNTPKVEITTFPRQIMADDPKTPEPAPAVKPDTTPVNVKPAFPNNVDVRTGTKIPTIQTKTGKKPGG